MTTTLSQWVNRCQSQVRAPTSSASFLLIFVLPALILRAFWTWIGDGNSLSSSATTGCPQPLIILSISSPTVVLCKTYFRFKALWIGDTISWCFAGCIFWLRLGLWRMVLIQVSACSCWKRHWHVRKSKDDFILFYDCFVVRGSNWDSLKKKQKKKCCPLWAVDENTWGKSLNWFRNVLKLLSCSSLMLKS